MEAERRLLVQMERCGMRITGQRKALVHIFVHTGKALSAREVHERMRQRYPGLSNDTVYRNIRRMTEIGLLEPVGYPEGVRYRSRSLDAGTHRHLAVCLGCERAIPLEFNLAALSRIAPERFTVVRHAFELYGYCPDCGIEYK